MRRDGSTFVRAVWYLRGAQVDRRPKKGKGGFWSASIEGGDVLCEMMRRGIADISGDEVKSR